MYQLHFHINKGWCLFKNPLSKEAVEKKIKNKKGERTNMSRVATQELCFEVSGRPPTTLLFDKLRIFFSPWDLAVR